MQQTTESFSILQDFRQHSFPLKMNRCHNRPTNTTTILLIPNGFTHYSPFLNLLIIQDRYQLHTLMNIQLPYKVIYGQQNFQSTLQSLIYSFIPLNARTLKTWSHTHKYCNQAFKRFLKPKYISHTIPQFNKSGKKYCNISGHRLKISISMIVFQLPSDDLLLTSTKVKNKCNHTSAPPTLYPVVLKNSDYSFPSG
jgi:hypothetical protein